MSFLNEIQGRKRFLRKTKTVVTQADGQRYVENAGTNRMAVTKLQPSRYGFIVDTKPDDVPVMIVPGIYIGAQDCSNKAVLDKYNISHVLSLGVDKSVAGRNCKYVSCLDLPNTDIRPILHECVRHIDGVLKLGESILIHCNAGVSRTAMVTIGYLMLSCKYSYTNAYTLVKLKRPVVQPNIGFVCQLKLICCEDYKKMSISSGVDESIHILN